MNAEQLKSLQAPIKERYKKDPAACSGDMLLEALVVQVHWAWRQGPRFGLPREVDSVEGWIVSA